MAPRRSLFSLPSSRLPPVVIPTGAARSFPPRRIVACRAAKWRDLLFSRLLLAMAQIKSVDGIDELWRRWNRWFPPSSGNRAGSIDASRDRAQADGGAGVYLRHRVCSAHGLPVEGAAQRVWQRQRGASAFSELAEGGLLSPVVAALGWPNTTGWRASAGSGKVSMGLREKRHWPSNAWDRTPRIGGKNGRKRSLLVDARGVPAVRWSPAEPTCMT